MTALLPILDQPTRAEPDPPEPISRLIRVFPRRTRATPDDELADAFQRVWMRPAIIHAKGRAQ